jgi:hypothetical protein
MFSKLGISEVLAGRVRSDLNSITIQHWEQVTFEANQKINAFWELGIGNC